MNSPRDPEGTAFFHPRPDPSGGCWLTTAPTPFTDGRTAKPPADLLAQAQDFAASHGAGFAFSHVTAARLFGWPVPAAATHDTRLHVMTAAGRPQIRKRGAVGHSGLDERRVVIMLGLPIVSPEDTWIDLASCIGNGLPFYFDDMIIAGDQAWNMVEDAAILRDAIARRGSTPGKRTLEASLPLLAKGSWSAGETRFRLGVVRSGLPRPELNVAIHDMSGKLVAIVDLLWRALRTFREYQGHEFHSTPDEVERDLARFDLLESMRWFGRPVDSDDIWVPEKRTASLLSLADDLRVPRSRVDIAAAAPAYFPIDHQKSRRRREPS